MMKKHPLVGKCTIDLNSCKFNVQLWPHCSFFTCQFQRVWREVDLNIMATTFVTTCMFYEAVTDQ